MPSTNNSNTPKASKQKAAAATKHKRKHIRRLAAASRVAKKPQTSQQLRQAAPLSRKKARKLEKKKGYARHRMMEATGEVEMKDVNLQQENEAKDKRSASVQKAGENGQSAMDVDLLEQRRQSSLL